jgi:hypothetical protein
VRQLHRNPLSLMAAAEISLRRPANYEENKSKMRELNRLLRLPHNVAQR